MKRYLVEEHDTYRGYEYAIVLQHLGHRCAYINVIGTDMVNVDYMNLENVPVHGGLTYSSSACCGLQEGWWIGWDYAHYADRVDYESLIFKMCENDTDILTIKHRLSIDRKFDIEGIIYTQYMVHKEVHKAIDEMIERGILNAR